MQGGILLSTINYRLSLGPNEVTLRIYILNLVLHAPHEYINKYEYKYLMSKNFALDY